MTEDSKAAGDPNQSEDGEDDHTSLSDPSDEQSMGKVEAVEGKQEVAVVQPQRRASTPPPPNLPVKLLTRLGSLEGEFSRIKVMVSLTGLQKCFTFIISLPRCSSSASEKVPSHLTQELHTSQRPSWLSVERQDLHTDWVPPPWGTTPSAAP